MTLFFHQEQWTILVEIEKKKPTLYRNEIILYPHQNLMGASLDHAPLLQQILSIGSQRFEWSC